MKNKQSFFYKLIFLVVITTVVLARLGIFKGTFYLPVFLSFTNLSNIYVVVITLITLIKMYPFIKQSKQFNPSPLLAKLRITAVLAILITGLVYHFILLPQKYLENPQYPFFTYGNIGSHYIAPIGIFVDWLFFDKKGYISKTTPLKWLSVPLAYFLIMSIYGAFGPAIPNKKNAYSYFFIDFQELGVFGVMKWCLFLLIGFLVLGYSFYVIDYLCAKKAKE